METTTLEDDISILSGLKSVVTGYLGALSKQCSRQVKERIAKIIPDLAECETLIRGQKEIEDTNVERPLPRDES